ncbi:hypothetical protein FH972_000627 [Carpinus fangiana]|uniref:Uncharacterized protein n=1 Tax=Carpinus fangiana TaxID=176857 RepID=A0A5N6Q9D1_9ROSI|nr:hypothetical protein FH972_000627 [Carpinus fangiana]
MIFEAVSANAYESPELSPLGFQYFVYGLAEEARGDYGNLYESCLLYADELKQRRVDQFKEGSPVLEKLAAAQWEGGVQLGTRRGNSSSDGLGRILGVEVGLLGLYFSIMF